MSTEAQRATIAVEPGMKFGRLLIVSIFTDEKGNRCAACICDCGKKTGPRLHAIRAGLTRSCGCYANETRSIGPRKHGEVNGGTETPEYRAWSHIKDRCYNPNAKEYHNYGGRGIVMCDKWLKDFPSFLADVGRRPSSKHSLDRYPNNDGNYEPGNVRWATPLEQSRNRRTHRINVKGTVVCLKEAAELCGIKYGTVIWRIRNGSAPRAALGLPDENTSEHDVSKNGNSR